MIIGIAGGSCTGKTTLLKVLENHFGDACVSLSFDDYFVGTDQLPDEVTDWEVPSLYRYDSFTEDLLALRGGRSIQLATKSRESTKLGVSSRLVEPEPFTFVEGFLIFWDETARELFDRRIFIELPEGEMLRRRLARSEGTSRWNDPEYIKTKLIPGHRNYVLPQRESADLVIDGLQPIDQMASEIIGFVRS